MDTKAKIALVWHNIEDTHEDFWNGRSYLEPVWDEIQGLRAIRMGDILFAIRLGAGLRIITIPKGTHPDVIAEMKTAARNLESFNGFFVIPEEGADINIETGQGQINYEALKLVLLQSIAAYTNYPIAGFQGLEMERQAGDFQEEKVLDVMRVIQRQVEPSLRWVIQHFSEFHEWGITEKTEYDFRWKGREEISEGAQAQLDLLMAQKDQLELMAGIVSVKEVRDRRGLKGPIPEKPSPFSIGVSGLEGDEEDNEEDQDNDVQR
jgi:hypothetical protein